MNEVDVVGVKTIGPKSRPLSVLHISVRVSTDICIAHYTATIAEYHLVKVKQPPNLSGF